MKNTPLLARHDSGSTDDAAILMAAIESQPAELTRYGVLADLLDERGYADLAHAYRWLMRVKRYPHFRSHYSASRIGALVSVAGRSVPAKYRWAWYSPSEADVRNIHPRSSAYLHALPWPLIRGDRCLYPTHAAAVAALAGWLKYLKDLYDAAPGVPDLGV